jgi:hypothetical protein
MSKVILKCVKEHNKLRIKFHSCINPDGNIYHNAYNNSYNCRFPKNIRKEGCYYEISSEYISLSENGGTPYYIVKSNRIIILDDNYVEEDVENEIVVFDADICVICLTEDTEIIFTPCGHKCVCNNCAIQMKKTNKCPICRGNIKSYLNNL